MKRENRAFLLVESHLPSETAVAIRKHLKDAGARESEVSEVRLRAYGCVGLVVSGKNVLLSTYVEKSDIRDTFKSVCGGAVFSHRDEIERGFIALDFGVRVGVGGRARYEDGRMVGVSDISSLVFRIPSGECSFARDLYRQWRSLGGGGMLVCSPAGGGKTTVIRSLSGLIGSGPNACRVVVVDERCEFFVEDYKDSQVDILQGYRRDVGVDIAIRTMSGEIIVVDEISSQREAEAMLGAIGAGASIIATVHAESLGGAMKREYVATLVEAGLFECVCCVSKKGGQFSFSLEKIGDNVLKSSHGKGDICYI